MACLSLEELSSKLAYAFEKIKQLEEEKEDLTKTIQDLRQKNGEKSSPSKVIPAPKFSAATTTEDEDTNYETDEEQLARETNWITIKYKKKKTDPSPPKPMRESKKRKAEESPETSVNASTNPARQQKPHTPPPMFVQNIKNIQQISGYLKTMNFQGKLTSLPTVTCFKINCSTPDEYRNVSDWLNKENISWHSFSNTQTRPLKVMARGMNPTTECNEIMDDLKRKGLKIIGVTNILNKSKEPLRLHMLTFENGEDVKKVSEIKTIAYQVVKIENLKKTSNRIVQCKNCQGYNHTRSYCHKPSRCVKCAGPHKSTDCTKIKESPPKCVNCNEEHTANYRGCIVAKELQKLKDTAGKRTSQVTKTSKTDEKKPTKPVEKKSSNGKDNSKTAEKMSYSQATKAHYTPTLTQVMECLERLENKVQQFNTSNESFKKKVLNRITTIEKRLNKSKR